MEKYNHKKIEKKWQNYWEKEKLYQTSDNQDKPKYYILDMFPYPSGAGLHVGHPKGYIATDIFARTKMMQGYNVLHPMGWDAFGLPAENYAIQNKTHPKLTNEKNIRTFKSQLEKLGFTYDWGREINTTDPEYYKWTQWVFIKMFEKGLAYESNEPVNWCPSCKTVLSNEDLEDGKCERCNSEVERKPMRQWVLKITDYADRLLNDLEKLPDWEESIKEMQRNWIGRSEGAEVEFRIMNYELQIKVFTTRPDTLFGVTFMVIAPEHKLIQDLKKEIKNYNEVEKYLNIAKNKSDLERTDLNKEKTGIKLDGVVAINPVNQEKIPIFVADYVIINYGTGAIMAVPGHDKRDFEFAKKYNIEIKQVVSEVNKKNQNNNLKLKNNKIFAEDGILINSGEYNNLTSEEAREKIINWLEEKKIGKKAVNYKLKDWVFSRQRYWGEPIPIVHCEECGNVAVPYDKLPLKLPEVKNYKPTGTGESPLANIKDWVNTICPKCGKSAKRETNTMPQWAGSSWYYLRYIDPHNEKKIVDKNKEKYWSSVDFYVGGAEHATRHLIYARFWHKFLYDIGVVNYNEPFTRLQHVGLILAEDGRKMSKRWNNVINPDEIVEKYGADAMRVYEMFMGPFSQPCAWSTNGLIGARRFLDNVYKIKLKIKNQELKIKNQELENLLHKTIKKVTEDIENFKFNTAISTLMIMVNKIGEQKIISNIHYSLFIILLSPFAPHLAEELWFDLGNKESIFKQAWPKYDLELTKDKIINLVIQVNGKLRDAIEVVADIREEDVKKIALKSEKIKKWLIGKEVVKIIFVKGKLLNIVIK
ncbi:MAG: leucine--tRNA ligase [Patescibacteria group bacterium]